MPYSSQGAGPVCKLPCFRVDLSMTEDELPPNFTNWCLPAPVTVEKFRLSFLALPTFFFLLSQLLRNLLPIFLRPRPHLAVLVFLSFDDRSRRKLAADHPFWRLRRSSWKNQPTAGRWLMSTRWRQDCRPVTQDFWRKSSETGEFGSWFTRLQRLSLVGALLMAGRGYLRASWVVEAELG